jgi:hypothetical protein
MSMNALQSPAKSKMLRSTWQLNSITSARITGNRGLRTSKNSDSAPFLYNNQPKGNDKLSTLVTQAGYENKMSKFDMPKLNN